MRLVKLAMVDGFALHQTAIKDKAYDAAQAEVEAMLSISCIEVSTSGAVCPHCIPYSC